MAINSPFTIFLDHYKRAPMSKNKFKVVVCRTCVRDNPGEGPFANPEITEKTYREKLKEGFFRSAAELNLHNCFNYCEQYYCVQVLGPTHGFQLKKISS